MKQLLPTVLISAVVSGVVVQAYRITARDTDTAGREVLVPNSAAAGGAPSEQRAQGAGTLATANGLSLSFTDALVEDVWINGARQAGDDHRALTDADHSICFITKIEIKGVQGPEDANSCVMQIDDFTGFWDLVATVEEGGQSEVRCNARCLVWE
jgi:hypothetical protein